MKTGHKGRSALKSGLWGTFNSKTIIVMMIAITPSLKASNLFLPMYYLPEIDFASAVSCSIPSKVDGSFSSELTMPEKIKFSNFANASEFFAFISLDESA
jgi:hypothetical protein